MTGPSTTLRPREITLRGLILGVLITFIFTAANTYLGLKVGLTFATSIPAAVISMAVLSFFSKASVLENNIVQTVASAAGALASIIFVLPGLVIVGWWTGFDFWTSFFVCAARRHHRRDLHDPPAPGDGDQFRPALSRRHGGGRSAESRLRCARRNRSRVRAKRAKG